MKTELQEEIENFYKQFNQFQFIFHMRNAAPISIMQKDDQVICKLRDGLTLTHNYYTDYDSVWIELNGHKYISNDKEHILEIIKLHLLNKPTVLDDIEEYLKNQKYIVHPHEDEDDEQD